MPRDPLALINQAISPPQVRLSRYLILGVVPGPYRVYRTKRGPEGGVFAPGLVLDLVADLVADCPTEEAAEAAQRLLMLQAVV